MPTDYIIYSAVSINVSTPVVLCADVTPPDAPVSGVAVTETYSSSWEQSWTVLPILKSGWSVLQHKISGLALRFGAQDAQLTLAPYLPFDPSFYVTFQGVEQNVQLFNVGSPTLIGPHAGTS